MKRYGAVITFQPGVSKEWAQMCLDRIAQEFAAVEVDDPSKRAIPVQEYDDCFGGPVWYCP